MTLSGSIGAAGARMPPLPGGVRAGTGRVLRIGVATSASLIVLGLAVLVARTPHVVLAHAVEQAHLAGRASFPHSLSSLAAGLRRLDGAAVVELGILVLLATPPAGLVAALVAFVQRGDRRFALFSAFVLAVIVGSAAVGLYLA